MFKNMYEFTPFLFDTLKGYRTGLFKKDLVAGITVGIVSLPLVMAFAVASGTDPYRGLYTAIVGGFLIALLGGSRAQIGGPTGAFIVVIYDIMHHHGYEGLVIATFMAAILLVLMGVFKLGSLIRFIPHPLIVGFTSGIATVIFVSQLKDFFGLALVSTPAHFVDKVSMYLLFAYTWDPVTLLVSLTCLVSLILIRKYLPCVPWGIAVIFGSTFLCWAFDIPVDTIYSRFGSMPQEIPSPTLNFAYHRALEMLPSALNIALLAGIGSLLSAVIADRMTGDVHKPDCELVAQGIGNLGSIVFGGIPATAAIARTVTNIKTGAQTPVAGIVHSLTLLVIVLLFGPLVGLIPICGMSAILVFVAWDMSEAHHFIDLLKSNREEGSIMILSFLLTVFIDLTIAVGIGVVLASFLFMKKMSNIEGVICHKKEDKDRGIEIYDMKGPLFFGVADRLKMTFQSLKKHPRIFAIRMKHVPVLDATGAYALRNLKALCQKNKITLVLLEVQPGPASVLCKYGLAELIKSEQDLANTSVDT